MQITQPNAIVSVFAVVLPDSTMPACMAQAEKSQSQTWKMHSCARAVEFQGRVRSLGDVVRVVDRVARGGESVHGRGVVGEVGRGFFACGAKVVCLKPRGPPPLEGGLAKGS